jgi:predicted enzyme related to lactoylglutathione lyase
MRREKMSMQSNAVGWFEVPVNDMDRVVAFYEAIFGYDLE